jgi:hypothetical protein
MTQAFEIKRILPAPPRIMRAAIDGYSGVVNVKAV